MPLPPPKASTEGPRDRQVAHEMSQVVRALRAEGPMSRAALADRLGAVYWDDDRFDRALGYVVADGLVVRTADGMLTTT
jgi:hypothetical protein